jgi:hypothetical protein
MKKVAVKILVLVLILSCKKNTLKNEMVQSKADVKHEIQWEIMSNRSDPLLAIAKTDTSEIEFYGDRNSSGIPCKLRQFIIKNQKDTLYYHLDDNSRPIEIRSSAGMEYSFVWKNNNEADLTATTQNGQNVVKTTINLNGTSKKSAVLKTTSPITATNEINTAKINNRVTMQAANTASPNYNVIIDITKCGRIETANIGVLGIELRTTPGNQDKIYIPVDFINGKYKASIPMQVSENLFPDQTVCDKIVQALSFACQLAPGNQSIIAASCEAITLAIAATGVGIPEAALFAGFCTSVAVGYDYFCLVTSGASSVGICNATYTRRVFNQIVILQPVAMYNGKLIRGEVLTTFGDSKHIDLKLDINECDGKSLLVGNTYTLSTWRYGASVPGLINFQAPANPPYFTFEPGQEYHFDNETKFTVTNIGIPPAPNQSASGFPFRIGSYSPDSLFLGMPGYGPTNSYGHQFPEGWGLKLPPGYELFLFSDYYPSRLSKDGRYIYRGDSGDMIFRKK